MNHLRLTRWVGLLLLACLSLSSWANGVPKRIVALSWDGAEQLLALGITPLAVAEPDEYQRWVVKPALPASVQSAGSRNQPNLEWLVHLKPDLIVMDSTLADMRAQLTRIAPTWQLTPFSQQGNNAEIARANYHALARLLGREAQARARLAAMQNRLTALRQQLQQHYPQGTPAVCVIRVNSPSVVYLYGQNAMPDYALQALGLKSACPVPTSAWGVAQRRVAELAQFKDATVLALAPLTPGQRLWHSPLWQAMPFVSAGRFHVMPATWTYGGVLSLHYLAEAIVTSLTA